MTLVPESNESIYQTHGRRYASSQLFAALNPKSTPNSQQNGSTTFKQIVKLTPRRRHSLAHSAYAKTASPIRYADKLKCLPPLFNAISFPIALSRQRLTVLERALNGGSLLSVH